MYNCSHKLQLPQIFRKPAAFLLAVSISTSSLLSGCSFSARLPSPSFTSSKEQEMSSDQAAFDQLTDKIFDENVNASIIDLHYTMMNPEQMGIEPPDSHYGTFTLEEMQRETKKLEGYSDALKAVKKQNLDKESQVDYEILETYLETELSCAGLELYVQPLAPTIGVQAQLPVLLAEYRFYRREDIEDYFSLLEGLDEYFGQILEMEQKKAAAGLMISDKAIDRILDSCRPYLEDGKDCLLYGTFAGRLEEIKDFNGNPPLTDEEKAAYQQRHEELITHAFIPAYHNLMEGLEKLKGTGRVEGGLCNYPDGKDYYRYMVYSSTYTSCKNVNTLRKTIEKRISEDFNAAAKLLAENPGLYDQLSGFSFTLSDPEEILSCLQEKIGADYPEPISREYSLHYVPEALEDVLSPAFYLTPPMDLPDSNTIYINRGSYAAKDQLFTTLAHEGYPGHLYQSSYFIRREPKPFRHLLSFSSYKEGWATYVEYDSCRLDEKISPEVAELMNLNSSINLGIHAYLDIMVNDQGWNLEQVSDYVSQYFEDPNQELARALLEAMVDNPTNYLEYYVGYLEFSDMRKKAEKALGKAFEAKAFHQFLLDIGPAPFAVIRKHLEDWIKERKKSW